MMQESVGRMVLGKIATITCRRWKKNCHNHMPEDAFREEADPDFADDLFAEIGGEGDFVDDVNADHHTAVTPNECHDDGDFGLPCCRQVPHQSLPEAKRDSGDAGPNGNSLWGAGFDDPMRWLPTLINEKNVSECGSGCGTNPDGTNNRTGTHADGCTMNNKTLQDCGGDPYIGGLCDIYNRDGECSEETWDYGWGEGIRAWLNPTLRTELPHHTEVQSEGYGRHEPQGSGRYGGGRYGSGRYGGGRYGSGRYGSGRGGSGLEDSCMTESTYGCDFSECNGSLDCTAIDPNNPSRAHRHILDTIQEDALGNLDSRSYEKATHHYAHANFTYRHLRNEQGIEGIAPKAYIYDKRKEKEENEAREE